MIDFMHPWKSNTGNNMGGNLEGGFNTADEFKLAFPEIEGQWQWKSWGASPTVAYWAFRRLYVEVRGPPIKAAMTT